jgi:DNA (cytosine-5)-methyltransferase 1
MENPKQPYKIATLFSGAGGLDTGFTKTEKFENQIANDKLDAPSLTYQKNHSTMRIQTVANFNEDPKLPCYIVGDVTDVNFEPLNNIDCVIGGPPCQDFSQVRGSRDDLGITKVRGKLYSHFIRALTKAAPKIFVFENVPGLVSSNGGLAYTTIVNDFENLNEKWTEIKNELKKGPDSANNYSLIFNGIVNSSDLGVPQKRKRLIIVGVRQDLVNITMTTSFQNEAKEILKGKKSLLQKYPITAMEAFEGKIIPDLTEKYSELMNEYDGIVNEVGTPEAFAWEAKILNNLTFDVKKDYLAVHDIKEEDAYDFEEAMEEHKTVLEELGYYGKPLDGMKFDDDSNNIPKESESVKNRMAHIPPNMNYLFVNGTEWKVKGTMSNIYRRSHPLKPGYTVMAYGGGGTWSYHYERGRSMLTNRERARLQTFPDDYMFEGNRSEVRAQIGEAVPVRLGSKLAELTLSVLEKVKNN